MMLQTGVELGQSQLNTSKNSDNFEDSVVKADFFEVLQKKGYHIYVTFYREYILILF